ncbi:hypothetical protein [Rhizobium leguminosarum]|uniref:hypothetical protein n=1 Tax=Rhizobium leguminosarum TaxID=384 RepID=UPI001FEE94F7|nr:hypothetical protein [Rhizobium leguminosarum]
MRVAAILFIAVCLFLAGATASRAYVSNSNLWLLATALVLYTLAHRHQRDRRFGFRREARLASGGWRTPRDSIGYAHGDRMNGSQLRFLDYGEWQSWGGLFWTRNGVRRFDGGIGREARPDSGLGAKAT